MNTPLECAVRVNCSIEHAFRVFTSKLDLWWPRGHRRFKQSDLKLEAKVGGRFFERSKTGEEAHLGDVIVCEPPKRITYTWYMGAINKPTEVDVRFIDKGDHTLVELTHAEGNSELGTLWEERVKLFDKGWKTVLPAFVNYAEETH